MNRHPEIADLALYSSGDLPLLSQWKTGRHVRQCPACSAEVAAFRQLATEPIAEQVVPEINWEPLAAEMRANIRLGLEASEAIAAYRRPTPAEATRLNWRAAVMVASLMAVIGSGWWFAVSAKKLEQPLAVVTQPAVVEANDSGVEIKDGNLTLELRTPASRASFSSVSTQGVAQTRYTDAETGQITVNHVYLD
jgi:anti-sigma factor RsiW